jgi:uncharacterized protein
LENKHLPFRPITAALWPEIPRWLPERGFPAYRHVPGSTRHPIRHPEGHSYDQAEEDYTHLTRDQWRDNLAYLYGVDLYHAGYLWEAHEAWENLWLHAKGRAVDADFFRGLICMAMAVLKVSMGNRSGATTLSQGAHTALGVVIEEECAESPWFMGLNLPDLRDDLELHFQPLWESPPRPPQGRPPCIRLVE